MKQRDSLQKQKVNLVAGYLDLEKQLKAVTEQQAFYDYDNPKYILLDKKYDEIERALQVQAQAAKTLFGSLDSFIETVNNYAIDKTATKKKLLENPSLAQCKKLIEREQNRNERPTISHYRDIENGMDKKDTGFKKFDKVTDITSGNWFYYLDKFDDKHSRISLPNHSQSYTVETDTLVKGWKFDDDIKDLKSAYYKKRLSNPRLAAYTSGANTYEIAQGWNGQGNQIFILYSNGFRHDFKTISELKAWLKHATSLTAKQLQEISAILKNDYPKQNPNPLASVIRDDKLKLARLEKELAKTPRNDYSKRERLKTSIRTLKESIAFQSNMFKNPTRTKATANGNEKDAVKDLQSVMRHIRFGQGLKEPSFLIEKLERFGRVYPLQDTEKRTLKQAVKEIEKGNKTGAIDEIWYLIESIKTYRLIPRKPRKNATHSDFRNYSKVALNDLSKMFQGELKRGAVRVLESDLTPDNKSRLGYLVQMKIKRNGVTIPIDFDGESFLSADLRRNLWASGKDARLDASAFRALGIKRPAKNGLTVLGDLYQIDYVTAKKHIENGETVRFYHKLGEATGERPKLAVDYDGFPIIIGGAYDVWNVGIVN